MDVLKNRERSIKFKIYISMVTVCHLIISFTVQALISAFQIANTVEFRYNSSSPAKMLFLWFRQNSYLLHALEFSYNNLGYIISSPIAMLFVSPCRIFCLLILTEFASFLHSVMCKLSYVEPPHKYFMTR